jgi:hypothetical protein
MNKFSRNLEEIGLFTIAAFLFGIVVAKILGHLYMESTTTQIFSVLEVFAAMTLCWIAGWKRGNK